MSRRGSLAAEAAAPVTVAGVLIRADAATIWGPAPAGEGAPPCACGRAAVATRQFPDAHHDAATPEGYCARHWGPWVRAVGAGG